MCMLLRGKQTLRMRLFSVSRIFLELQRAEACACMDMEVVGCSGDSADLDQFMCGTHVLEPA